MDWRHKGRAKPMDFPSSVCAKMSIYSKRLHKNPIFRAKTKLACQYLKSVKQAQRFVTAHATVQNLFNLGRHLVRAEHYRALRASVRTE